MDKKEIIARIDHLQFRLLKLHGEDEALDKTIAHLKWQKTKIKEKKKKIHDEVTKLKVEVLKMGL